MSYPRSLQDIQDDIFSWAERKGWTEKLVYFPEQIALIHSEISEALEAYRDGIIQTIIDDNGKPQGYYSELADAAIRILHYCTLGGVSLEREITTKMKYNETRPYRHGGKAI